MLRLQQVTKRYTVRGQLVCALDGVDLPVNRGEYLVVRGASGSGKTTLLLTLGGMLRPTSGSVWLDSADLYALTPAERALYRRREVGFVFQMFHLIPYLTAWENVLQAAGPGNRTQAKDKAAALLQDLGLDQRLHNKPGEMSAGERQRTALARALFNQPRLILADEPTGNLDPENAAQVFQRLRQYHSAGGTVVMVTHSAVSPEGATRTVELKNGAIISSPGHC